MEQKQFCLSWQPYSKNISHSLCALQQNGEFVDMTLAADGHFVKVHRVIMAFASPYIKDLISSIECSHPVLFLNKISYKTLCSLLEYIYTGEVKVWADNFNEFIEAGKELHIKGLDDLDTNTFSDNVSTTTNADTKSQIPSTNINLDMQTDTKACEDPIFVSVSSENKNISNNHCSIDDDRSLDNNSDNDMQEDECEKLAMERRLRAENLTMQYTLSTRGRLQLILNRYIYYFRHLGVKHRRTWRCIDYMASKTKCPAFIFTQDNKLVKRSGEHNHPYHDSKIIQKMAHGTIYTAVQEAEKEIQEQQTKKPNT